MLPGQLSRESTQFRLIAACYGEKDFRHVATSSSDHRLISTPNDFSFDANLMLLEERYFWMCLAPLANLIMRIANKLLSFAIR